MAFHIFIKYELLISTEIRVFLLSLNYWMTISMKISMNSTTYLDSLRLWRSDVSLQFVLSHCENHDSEITLPFHIIFWKLTALHTVWFDFVVSIKRLKFKLELNYYIYD